MLLSMVGGVLFKVFIVGESIKVVRRFSLPDLSETDISTNSGVFGFPRVSGADSSADDVDLDPAVAGKFDCTCRYYNSTTCVSGALSFISLQFLPRKILLVILKSTRVDETVIFVLIFGA